ncbi:MAG: DUF99 family protein [Haloferacaceae archaeon]
MTAGARALGVAESYGDGDERSVLCGAVVRTDRVADGFAVGTCAVGGADATDAVAALFRDLGREDVGHLLLSGVAPAWFNLLDIGDLHGRLDRPVISVSFEDSPGLEPALREQFSGEALEERLAVYRSLPARRPVETAAGRLFVRAAGTDDATAAETVRAHVTEGSRRPEPIRVARLAARAVRRWRGAARASASGPGRGETAREDPGSGGDRGGGDR